MNYYIRNFCFKRKLFSRKSYIYFEFYLGDKWRKGKITYFGSENNLPTIGIVSSQIISYIQNFISTSNNFWSESQIRNMISLTEQFNKEVLMNTTKLFK